MNTTYKEAVAAGLKRYFTGKPCPYGHVADRLVSTRACSACALEKKRVWNLSNPDKVNSQKRDWRNANLEKARAQNLANQKVHREAANARNRKYYKTNLKARAAKAAWQKAHPENVTARAAKRRASERQQMPAWADVHAINLIYRAAQILRTSGFDVHVDHIVPIQGKVASGLHVHQNLQILSAKANRSKSNRI